jgi:hypothetical protein
VSKKRTLKRLPVEKETIAFRVLGTDSLDPDDLAPWFLSDREDGRKLPDERERRIPELQDGRSMFATEKHARIRWAGMRKNATYHSEEDVQQGSYIAEVVLMPGQGFDIEDRGKRDGHLTVWGDSAKFVGSVRRIFIAGPPE